MTRRSRWAVALLLGFLPTAGADATDGVREAIALGDEAWARRAEGHSGLRAAAGPIDAAIARYREAFTADPGDLESRWKLMRALYFRGEHVVDGHEEKLEIFARGRRLGEEGIDQLAERAGGRVSLDEMAAAKIGRLFEAEPNAAGIYLWTGIHWGLWGRERGKLAAARRGVVGKVRDYSEIAVAIDPRFDNAGGHRVLGRLHAEAPRIPFITGWVDHQRSIRELERSLELVPSSILSELFLIEALLDYDRARRSEALERLTRLVERPPDVGYVVEDLNALADARSLLERWSDRR